jgi:ubiquinone/menaquinone biosynthesis C-methylase UbiE
MIEVEQEKAISLATEQADFGRIWFRLRRAALRIYWWLARVITPGLRDSQYLYKETLEYYVPRNGSWLELGCGHQIFPAWIRSSQQAELELLSRTRVTVGIDPDLNNVSGHATIRNKSVAMTEQLPFRDESFDLLSANMVMEHLHDPVAALSEARRVLRTGGTLIFHTPNFRNYQAFLASLMPKFLKNRLATLLEGRADKDVFPVAYKLNTSRQIYQVAAKCGFRVVDTKIVNSTAASAVFLPTAFLELLLMRLLEAEAFRDYRTNIVAILQKQ